MAAAVSLRHGRACPGHPPPAVEARMAGTRPAMTMGRRPCSARPLAPATPHFHRRNEGPRRSAGHGYLPILPAMPERFGHFAGSAIMMLGFIVSNLAAAPRSAYARAGRARFRSLGVGSMTPVRRRPCRRLSPADACAARGISRRWDVVPLPLPRPAWQQTAGRLGRLDGASPPSRQGNGQHLRRLVSLGSVAACAIAVWLGNAAGGVLPIALFHTMLNIGRQVFPVGCLDCHPPA